MAMVSPLRAWCGRALVVGGGGIGAALVAALERRAPGLERLVTSRQPQGPQPCQRAGCSWT